MPKKKIIIVAIAVLSLFIVTACRKVQNYSSDNMNSYAALNYTESYESNDNNVVNEDIVASNDISIDEKESGERMDVTGSWYDPTGLSPGGFTLNGDGTGTWVWDYSGNSSPPDAITYEIRDEKIIIHLKNSSFSMLIEENGISDGDSTYVKQ